LPGTDLYKWTEPTWMVAWVSVTFATSASG
jgi:hypothetical protein